MMVQADGPVVVREERQLDDVAGVGEVAILAGESPTADDTRVAAARAWLSVTRSLHAAGELDAACTAASSGLEELGQAYLDPEADDDTTLKLLAAEDAHDRGQNHAAAAMARVLEMRLAMFVDSHPARRLTPLTDNR